MTTIYSTPPGPTAAKAPLPVRALMAITWLSAAIFSLYILVFYGGAILAQSMDRDWNQVLPRLYDAVSAPASAMIGLHFFAGATVLILGPLQFNAAIRRTRPTLHHWTGRVYVAAALAAGIGGLAYIALKGAVGGLAMDLGFIGYGVLTVLAAILTIVHARARRLSLHRAWAIRLFALGIGSWLYRMDYGIWLKLFGGPGHTHSFDGPFDHVMDVFFYLPNLAVAELIIRHKAATVRTAAWYRPATLALWITVIFVTLATVLFTRSYWAPHIADRLAPLFH
jgi:hypothetical protein